MMNVGKHNSNGEKGGTSGSPYRDVHSPARTDGVGVALRNAFTANDGEGEDDFQKLIQALDRKTIS